MASQIIPEAKQGFAAAAIDWAGATTVRMCASTDDLDAGDDFLNDVTGILATSDAITGRTNVDGVCDCADITFPSTGQTPGTATHFYVYIDTGSAATSRLITMHDSDNNGIPYAVDNAAFTFVVNASGLFAI